MKWFALSQDLNPIEHFWRMRARALYGTLPPQCHKSPLWRIGQYPPLGNAALVSLISRGFFLQGVVASPMSNQF